MWIGKKKVMKREVVGIKSPGAVAGNVKVVAGGSLEKYVPPPPCHTGNCFVFTDPVSGLRVVGGGSSKGAKWYQETAILLDLADNWPPVFSWGGMVGKRMRETQGPRIAIPWKDYKAPDLFRDEWEAVLGDVREEAGKRKKVKDLLVCCIGGHGRTGTALAILAGLCGVCEGKDPILFVREKYCEKAVEATAQIEYVEKILGYKSEAKPAKTWEVSGPGVVYYGAAALAKPLPKSEADRWKEVTCKTCGGPKVGGTDTCLNCHRREEFCVCADGLMY